MTRRESRISRAPILVTVVVAVVVAAAFGSARHGESKLDARARRTDLAATSMPPHDARSAAWYCAAGTAARGGVADEAVIVSNVGTATLHAQIDVMAGGAQPAGTTGFDLRAGEQRRVRVGDVAAVPSPGVVVEVFDGEAAVEHLVTHGSHVAVSPCARSASTTWYLPAGTTVPGTQQWLSLFDPFDDDAIVDVTFLTDGGPQAPDALQGLVVPRRSKLLVPVHDDIARQNLVTTVVRARTGRVVAEQTLVFTGAPNRSGIALTLGLPGVARDWYLPVGSPTGGPSTLVVANPGSSAARVQIAVLLDGQARLSPETITVGAESVVAVDLLAHVPPNTGFSVRVRSSAAVVVGELSFGASGGASSVAPSPVTATRWVFAMGRVGPSWTDTLVVANASSRTVRVRVTAHDPGATTSVTGNAPVAVPAGARVIVDLAARRVAPRAAVTVEGDGPLVAERVDTSPGTSAAALGIPDLN
ncbi:MAG TPA: DUF5719 family protein [Acidimicrobiia bacterium]|nr:DUF5719 family protein [Acidimicrobiia bacterium]